MTKWVQRLIIANVIMFFIELAGPRELVNALVLVPRNVLFTPWTMITYMFLHDPSNFTHILFNMLGLYWFGVSVEERLGANRFLALYFISGLAGAILSIFLSPNAAVIGASVGAIGTAVGQQSLRAVLSFCNARQMTSPEAYIHYSPEVFTGDGRVANEATEAFLRDFMTEFRDHIERVLTVLPREVEA